MRSGTTHLPAPQRSVERACFQELGVGAARGDTAARHDLFDTGARTAQECVWQSGFNGLAGLVALFSYSSS
jgi:hypothetical protein